MSHYLEKACDPAETRFTPSTTARDALSPRKTRCLASCEICNFANETRERVSLQRSSTMTDTAASSPLSELSDPIPPPDSVIEPAAPPHEAEQTSSSKIVHHVAASPLTSASKVTSPSATKKVPCKPRRKSNGTFQKKVANESTLPIEEESCPACQHLDARARTAQRRDSTVWVECDK